ncbi:hypothetical protein ONZ45_g11028 [Pleurotus djamor]|nr:hypothetical protein ONZ45_g11028 [Pleurotus djamor]
MAPIRHAAPSSSSKHSRPTTQQLATTKRQAYKRSRLNPNGIPPIFKEYLESPSTSIVPYAHNPKLKTASVTLQAATDRKRNDIFEHAGDSIHNLTVAEVLHGYFFLEPGSGSGALGVDYDHKKRCAAFEHAIIVFSQNVTQGRIQCRMTNTAIPHSGRALKRHANQFEAHTAYLKKTYPKAQLIAFYQSFILPALPSIHPDFDEEYATEGTIKYLGTTNGFRGTTYREVNRRHEEALLQFLETNQNDLIRSRLRQLDTPETVSPPIKFDKKDRVIEDCRPLDVMGYLLWKYAVASAAELLYTWHHAHQVGGAQYRSQLCSLAASKGVCSFLAVEGGLLPSRRSEQLEHGNRMPSRFFVAVGKMWKHDEKKLEDILRSLAMQIIRASDTVLAAQGVSLPFCQA